MNTVAPQPPLPSVSSGTSAGWNLYWWPWKTRLKRCGPLPPRRWAVSVTAGPSPPWKRPAVTAVGIMTVGYAVGYGVALINPFTVLIAQDVAGLQPASGLWFRLALMAVFLPIGIHHVWSYAKKVGRDPSASLVADTPLEPGRLGGSDDPGASRNQATLERGAGSGTSGVDHTV